MTTIISHFYNEEYMLPWWLDHHSKIFDHGIMIDYKSTDNSRKIIQEMCPTWQIIDSRNELFSAKDCDEEVMAVESAIVGYKIALNITEFWVGNIKKLTAENNEQYLIPCVPMIDSIADEYEEPTDDPLIPQRLNGIDFTRGESFFDMRKARSLHRTDVVYSTGRHFKKWSTHDCCILWYGYSPFTEQIINRKLQIQNKIPEADKINQLGREHLIDRDQLLINFRNMQQHAQDLTSYIMPLYGDTF